MKAFVVFLFLGMWLSTAGPLLGQEAVEPTASPNVQLLAEAFDMPELKRNRRIWIYLPPDYDTTETNYPVLYMQDGQNLFDESLAWMGNEWKVDESLNAFFEAGLEGLIVVGIEHGEEFRDEEYAPWVRDVNGVIEGGQGKQYAEFLVNTLKPYVDSNFRTLPEREHTGIAGSSLGGLISLYTALAYPETFSKVGVISPALFYNPEIIEYAATQPYTHETRFYFVTSEEEGVGMIGRIDEVYQALLGQGHAEEHVKRELTTTGAHNEIYFGERFPDLYSWLYEPQERPPVEEPPIEPEIPTGLEEVEADESGISLFPNPTQLQLRLNLSEDWRKQAEGYLMDVQGRRLSPLMQLEDGMLISVASLPQGLFFLVVQTDKKRTVLRVIKE